MQLMYEYLVNEASSSSASAADAGKVRGAKRLDEQACKHRGAARESENQRRKGRFQRIVKRS